MALALDGRAVIAGTGAALALAVPAALVAQIVDGTADGAGNAAVLGLAFLIVLVGFAVGGYVAAARGPDSSLTHGAAAALVAFVVVQAFGVIRRSVAGEEITWLAIPFNALVAAVAGTIGGIVADRRRATA